MKCRDWENSSRGLNACFFSQTLELLQRAVILFHHPRFNFRMAQEIRLSRIFVYIKQHGTEAMSIGPGERRDFHGAAALCEGEGLGKLNVLQIRHREARANAQRHERVFEERLFGRDVKFGVGGLVRAYTLSVQEELRRQTL